MKRPNSTMQILGIVFIILGVAFIGAGYLNKAGILPTSTHSKSDPAVIFPIVGIAFLAAGLIFFFVPLYREKKLKMLKSTGIRLHGTVTGIKQLPYTQMGKKHPYIIYFSYEHSGNKYEGKSHLIWDKPSISEGDAIVVYIDQHNKHQYYAEVQ